MTLRALTSGSPTAPPPRPAETVATDLRERVLRHLAYEPDAAGADTGRSALLATHGVDEVKPYLTRYLPAVLLTVLVPPSSSSPCSQPIH
jgi:ABC-type transport system involved in cytochrome bd biosynthesis fused ATPase/permease subunit